MQRGINRFRAVYSNGVALSLGSLTQSGHRGAKWPPVSRPIHWIAFWAVISCWHANGALLLPRPLDTSSTLLHQHDSTRRQPPAGHVSQRRFVGLGGLPAQCRSAARIYFPAPKMLRHSRAILQGRLPGSGFQAKKYFTYVFFGAAFFNFAFLKCCLQLEGTGLYAGGPAHSHL